MTRGLALQAISLYLIVESGFRDFEALGNEAFIAVVTVQGLADELSFELLGGFSQAQMGETIGALAGIYIFATAVLLEVLREILYPDVVFIAEGGHFQGLVLELANVARPGMFSQGIEYGSLHGDRF